MTKIPLRTNIARLVQKSRQAVNLYSDLINTNRDNKLKLAQLAEWKNTSLQIVDCLSSILGLSHNSMTSEVYLARDRFYQDWRSAEGRLIKQQKVSVELIERGDFIKVLSLLEELVILKAKVQALQAAYNEINTTLTTSNAQKLMVSPVEQSEDQITEMQSSKKVIQLRKIR